MKDTGRQGGARGALKAQCEAHGVWREPCTPAVAQTAQGGVKLDPGLLIRHQQSCPSTLPQSLLLPSLSRSRTPDPASDDLTDAVDHVLLPPQQPDTLDEVLGRITAAYCYCDDLCVFSRHEQKSRFWITGKFFSNNKDLVSYFLVPLCVPFFYCCCFDFFCNRRLIVCINCSPIIMYNIYLPSSLLVHVHFSIPHVFASPHL